MVHQLKPLSYKCVQKKVKLISDSLGQTKNKMWRWWRRNDNRNVVLTSVVWREDDKKCVGGGGGVGGKKIELQSWLNVKKTLETFRFEDENDYEYEI